MIKKNLPYHFRVILFYFIGGMGFFSLIRLLHIFIYQSRIPEGAKSDIWRAIFIYGPYFDMVTLSYLLAVPVIIFSVFYLMGYSFYKKKVFSSSYFLLSISFFLFLSFADFPYFNYYNLRISNVIFSWNDQPLLALETLFTDWSYLKYILLFFILSILQGKYMLKTQRNISQTAKNNRNIFIRIPVFFISLIVLFFILRGKIDLDARPVSVKDSMISKYEFVNNATLNPVFNFFHSYNEYPLNLIDSKEALKNVQNYLNVTENNITPISRTIKATENEKHYNVVLVLMESMSSNMLGRFHPETNSVTPNLDTLISKSICFSNTYTSGIHTYNGIFSSLYGYPTYFDEKPLSGGNWIGSGFSGMPQLFKNRDYNTSFICTGNTQFDNMKNFLESNSFDNVIGEEVFNDNEKINSWGVPDHILYEYGIRLMDSLHNKNMKFFTTLLSISTHPPYDYPEVEGFVASAKTKRDNSYLYADWAIGQFLKNASTHDWFNNTVFVFVADHGLINDVVYSLPLSYHHSPMIFYCPSDFHPQLNENISLQIDLYPTLAGLLNFNYINNSFGVDLLKHKRPFAFFSGDEQIGILNEQYYLISDPHKGDFLFEYKNHNLNNLVNFKKDLVNEMKNYGFSMFQTTKFLVENNQTK